MNTNLKIQDLLMATVLILSASVVYADGNGGNISAGQTTVINSQIPSDGSDHEWKHGGWSKHRYHREGNSFHKLNLTDDQEKQMKDLWQKERESMKATHEQIKTNREAFNKELSQSTSDMAKINDLQGQLKALQAQIVDSRLNSVLDVKKILTPEQFGKYLELRKHMLASRFHKAKGEHGKRWNKHDSYCRNHSNNEKE